jgi:GntR family transcriptional regulator, arabinose operon transcriptional repressor
MDIPKYEMVKNYIKHLLMDGTVSYGEKLPSEYELIAKFNVSRHTIRKAFAELSNTGYIYKKQGKGTFSSYKHNEKPKQIIAVLSTFISSFVFPSIIAGIEEILSDEGYMMLLSNTNNTKEKEAQFLTNILGYNVVGMIVEPAKSAIGNPNLKLFNEIHKGNIKTVFINSVYEDFSSPYVLLDDIKGGFIVTEYLIQLGHRKIACIMKTDDKQGIDRSNGMVSAMQKYNVSPMPEFIGSYDTHSMYEAPYILAQSLMRKSDRPTAVFCYNDQCALMVIQAIHDSGLSVPNDISVVGYDDSLELVQGNMKLTTVSHPKKEMGKQAAKFLVEMLNGRLDFPQKIFQPELIVRTSCHNV